jgi:hypothetical protein
MTGMVLERFKGRCAADKLLAVALAEHACPNGTSIFPSIARLAQMSEQSERSVQYKLREFLRSGWLVLVREEERGRARGRPREYRINPDWIAGRDFGPPATPEQPEEREVHVEQLGADSAPNSDTEKGATGDGNGCKKAPEMGATAIAPEPTANQKLKGKEARVRADAPVAARPEALSEFPIAWQPDAQCREVLRVRSVPWPEKRVIDEFAAHWAGKWIEPRRIANEFLKWVSRERGYQQRDGVGDGAKRAGQPVDDALQTQADAAWNEVYAAVQEGGRTDRWRKVWTDPRTAAAFNAIGGYGGRLRDIGDSNRRFIRQDFIKAFCEQISKGSVTA